MSASSAWLGVVGYARTGQDAIALAKVTQPRIVLLGSRLPDLPAGDVIDGLRRGIPDVKIVMFVASADLGAAATPRADAMIYKDADPARLLETLLRVDRGEQVPGQLRRAARSPRIQNEYGITRREQEILRRVAIGETNAEVARALGLANSTVKTYFQRALEKLGARNRVEAIVRAGEIGLL